MNSATNSPRQTILEFEEVSATHWDWVHQLIKDVKDQEHHESLVALWAQWRMAVRQFRNIEFKVMRQDSPTATDLKFHNACLSCLMSIGEFLLLEVSRKPRHEEFQKLGFNRNDAEATLAALKHNW